MVVLCRWLFCPLLPPDGYAVLLSDGERNVEEDSAGRRGFSRQPICVHRRSSAVFIFSALQKSGFHDALEVA
ncbi:MAG: hypothetical protein O8C66_05985 [Candidatus Methanoperedens sp.]|nr:hypothetical protein [Candidatus Methanoperedens sp.]MCZ7370040.1 hypothetical protein [Candidatus Methanoperedens sp.]